MATLAPSDGFRSVGQLSLTSLQLASPANTAWQYASTPAGCTTKANGVLVATMAADGSLTTTGGLALAKGLQVTGAATVSGATSLAGLTVSGAAQLSGATIVAASLTQTGSSNAVSLAGPVTIANSLSQTGTGAVNVAGPAFLNGATTVAASLNQTGTGNAVSLAGPTMLTNTLTVAGSFATNLGGALVVTGTSSLANLQVSGLVGINVTSPTVQLDVGGAAQFSQAAAGKQVAVRNTSTTNDTNGAEVYFDRTAVAATQYAKVGMSGTTRNFYINVGGGTDEISIAPQGAITINQPLSLANSTSFTGNYPELGNRPWATVYSGATAQLLTKMWFGTATTTSGAATFYPTSTNASGGTALFTTILNVQTTAVVNTTTATAVVYTGVRTISTTAGIVVNCVAPSGLGNAPTAATNGTVIHCLVVGL